MPSVEFEPTITVGERPNTYALDIEATETGWYYYINVITYQDLHKFKLVFMPLAANIEIISVKTCQIAESEILMAT
jgi:hypothetical protein